MEDHLFVCRAHIGGGRVDGIRNVWEVKSKENKYKCTHRDTHIAILLMSVLEGGLHYASEGLGLD